LLLLQMEAELLSLSATIAAIKQELEALERARAEEGADLEREALQLKRSNAEKLLVSIPSCAASVEVVEAPDRAAIIQLILSVLALPLEPNHPDFFLIPHAVTLFIFAAGEFEEEAKPHFPAVLDFSTKLLTKLSQIPTFGKKTEKDKERDARAEEGEEDSDDDDEEGGLFGGPGKKLSAEEYQLFAFSQCSRLFVVLLSDAENRVLFVEIGNPIVAALSKVIIETEFPQLKLDSSEVLAQICLLSLHPEQVKIWEDLQSHQEIIEGFIGEEEGGEGGEICDATGDFEFYDPLPFFPSALDPETLGNLAKHLTELNGSAESLLAQDSFSDEGEMSVSAVVSVLCCIAVNQFEPEVSTKIIQDCMDTITAQLSASNQSPTCLDKIPLVTCIGHILALAPAPYVEAHFTHYLTLLDSLCSKELQKIQPKPSGGRGRGGRGGGKRGGGRGGRGRGGGGGGGGGSVDPQKEMEFRILQRVIAKSLAWLFPKGGLSMIPIANKFLTTTGPSFKYRDLTLEFLIGLRRVLLTEAGQAHELYKTVNDLCTTKTSGQYQFCSDNTKAKFGTTAKKLEGIRCIFKLSTASTAYKSGIPLFPEYLGKALDLFLEVVATSPEECGAAATAALETILRVFPGHELVVEKLPAVVDSCLALLKLQAPDNEQSAVHSSLHLSAFDIMQFIYKTSAYQPAVKAETTNELLAKTKEIMTKALGKVVEMSKSDEPEGEKKEEGAEAAAAKPEEGETTTTTTPAAGESALPTVAATPTSNVIPKTETVAFPKFNFTSGAVQGAAEASLPAFAFPKFNFGGEQAAAGGAAATPAAPANTAAAAPAPAFPTFDWAALSAAAAQAPDDESSEEEDLPVKGGRGGRGARGGGGGRGAGGRGRGRGRGRAEIDSDDDDSDDDEFDNDSDEDDSDDFDIDSDDLGGAEEEDELEEQASLCVAALETIVAAVGAAPAEEKAKFKDLVTESIAACDTLSNATDLGGIILKLKDQLTGLQL